jgi:trypsin
MKTRILSFLASTAALSTLVACGADAGSDLGSDSTAQTEQSIIGGTAAPTGSNPWQARLSITKSNGTYLCGGSLIASRWVMTAAHCIPGATSIQVTLGDTTMSKPDAGEQVFSATRVIMNPWYNSASSDSDIALIELSGAAVPSSTVKVIELAAQDIPVGTSVRVSGWGRYNTSSSNVSDTLQQLTTVTQNNATCTSELAKYGTLTDNMICAGSSSQGACHGDSGGPLVATDASGTPKLVGVVSWGAPTCSVRSVFTRVTRFRDWALKTMSAVQRKGMTWGKFYGLDAQLDPLSSRGLDRVGCWGEPLMSGAACNAYQGDTACTESRPMLCVKQDGSPRPAYAMQGSASAMSVEYYNGWANGELKLTTLSVPGYWLTSKAEADRICGALLGSAWRMAEFHDGKYVPGMDATHYFGSTWTSSAAQQQRSAWNLFAHGNIQSTTSRFWVSIDDQAANCWN